MSDMNFTLVSHNGHFSGPAYRRELDEAIARRDREQASLQAAVLEQRRQRIEARQLSGPVVTETQEATQFIDQTFDFPRLWADFFDLYTPHGDWWFGGGTSKQDRKHGRMWPFYRNENELNWLRAMSRFVAGWNGGHAGGFVGGLCGYVVGKGMVPKCVPTDGTLDPQDKLLCKAVDRVLQNFYDQELFPGVKFTEYQQHVFNQTLIDGDSYTWMFDVGDHLTLRPVWPELITQPSGGTFEEWGFGHHTHPDDTLHVVAYHVANGEGADGVGVDAADMVHIPFFRPGGWTPGIKRGLPLFSFGVKESIDAAGKLVRNMTEGEAIRQAIAYIEQQAAMTERSQALEFATNAADVVVAQTVNASRQIPSIKAVPGYVPKIPQGYEYQAPPSAQTSPAIEVVDCALRAAGQIFNAPAWLVGASGRDQAAYSSDLVHEAPFVKRIEACQEFFGNRFLAILYRVVNIAVRNGLLPPDTLRRVRLTMEYPAVVSRDAAEETQSNTAYIEAGVKSVQQVQQELSLDPEKIRHEVEEFSAWKAKAMPQLPVVKEPEATKPGETPNATNSQGPTNPGGNAEAVR